MCYGSDLYHVFVKNKMLIQRAESLFRYTTLNERDNRCQPAKNILQSTLQGAGEVVVVISAALHLIGSRDAAG